MSSLGCYYLHTFYPSNLFLEDSTFYDFKIEGKFYSILIIRHLKSLIINDFDNKIIEAENGLSKYQIEKKEISVSEKNLTTLLKDGEVTFILDYKKNQYKEFYTKKYTEIIVSFESVKDDRNIDMGLKALHHFIDSYRLVANDILTLTLEKLPYISRVIKEGFHFYSEDELSKTEKERVQANRGFSLNIKQVLFPFWNTEGKIFQTDPKKNTALLKGFFENGKMPDSLSEFVLKAREELYIHKNYKYSFIESWTVLEMAIVSFLRKVKLEKGISKNKIDAYESEVGISYLLNIELPLIHQTNDQKFKELVSKGDSVRKLRNKVIHENRAISHEEAENALLVAIDFLNYFGYRRY